MQKSASHMTSIPHYLLHFFLFYTLYTKLVQREYQQKLVTMVYLSGILPGTWLQSCTLSFFPDLPRAWRSSICQKWRGYHVATLLSVFVHILSKNWWQLRQNHRRVVQGAGSGFQETIPRAQPTKNLNFQFLPNSEGVNNDHSIEPFE